MDIMLYSFATMFKGRESAQTQGWTWTDLPGRSRMVTCMGYSDAGAMCMDRQSGKILDGLVPGILRRRGRRGQTIRDGLGNLGTCMHIRGRSLDAWVATV